MDPFLPAPAPPESHKTIRLASLLSLPLHHDSHPTRDAMFSLDPVTLLAAMLALHSALNGAVNSLGSSSLHAQKKQLTRLATGVDASVVSLVVVGRVALAYGDKKGTLVTLVLPALEHCVLPLIILAICHGFVSASTLFLERNDESLSFRPFVASLGAAMLAAVAFFRLDTCGWAESAVLAPRVLLSAVVLAAIACFAFWRSTAEMLVRGRARGTDLAMLNAFRSIALAAAGAIVVVKCVGIVVRSPRLRADGVALLTSVGLDIVSLTSMFADGVTFVSTHGTALIMAALTVVRLVMSVMISSPVFLPLDKLSLFRLRVDLIRIAQQCIAFETTKPVRYSST